MTRRESWTSLAVCGLGATAGGAEGGVCAGEAGGAEGGQLPSIRDQLHGMCMLRPICIASDAVQACAWRAMLNEASTCLFAGLKDDGSRKGSAGAYD
jgi:hypothetical protein